MTCDAHRLAARTSDATLAFQSILTSHIGERLGPYENPGRRGPSTAAELAGRTGTHERYAREWLEQPRRARPRAPGSAGNHGWSVLTCLASSTCGEEPAGAGTFLRRGTLESCARRAGFSSVEDAGVPREGWTLWRLAV